MKQLILILIIVTFFLCLLAAETDRGIQTRSNLFQDTANQIEFPDRVNPRSFLPPTDLTAAVIDLVNVQLNWNFPTDLIHIFYHDGIPVEGYYQTSNQAYGTVFDLTEYPDVTLEYLDFRHSPWSLNNEWEYSVIILDWDEGTLIHISEDLSTTVNDGWETDINLNSITAPENVGIFIIPLGNTPQDAYPVIDLDAEREGDSYVISAADYSITDVTVGDFLIDLWVREINEPVRRVSADFSQKKDTQQVFPEQIRENVTGYNIYRNDAIIEEISDPQTTSFFDENLSDGSYTYYVTALYADDESEPSNSVSITINTDIQVLWNDDFENHPDFAADFPPWTVIDLDGGPTYGLTNVTFPGEYEPMGFIIFNPSETTPPLTGLNPTSGKKMAASFASSNPPNDNWLITPPLTLGTESSLTFQARSYSSTYGLEIFRVGVSTTEPDPGSFSIISAGQYETAPAAWTEYTYDLSDYDEQTVYLAINCLSDDAWLFLVDDFKVLSVGGSNTEDMPVELPERLRSRNYPNPFNPETTIEFYLREDTQVRLEIFNIRGQRIAVFADEFFSAGTHRINWAAKDMNEREVKSGVYLYRITTGNNTETGRMLLLK